MSALVVFDLFAGAGGFGLGFKQAGYQVDLSLEIDQWACDTLRYNHPDMRVIQDDICKFDDAEKIQAEIVDHPHVIIGGPPCQGFSISGPAKKDPKDPRNSLFKNFAQWVEVLRPEAFVMENVKGLLSRRNAHGEKVIEIIQETFANLGYCVNIWVLNAAEYGVPQSRERVFIVGSTSKHIPPPFPTHQSGGDIANAQLQLTGFELAEAVSLWEAISDLPELLSGQGEEIQSYTQIPQNPYQRMMRENPCQLFNHVAMNHTKRMIERFKKIRWGESIKDVTDEHGPRQRGNSQQVSSKLYDQNNRRLYPNRPSHTITASFYANFIHPHQHRNLTAREGARIQSFPDTYRFLGKPTIVSKKLLAREGRFAEAHLCQYNQIGNAVPPLLAKQIAIHLKKELFTC